MKRRDFVRNAAIAGAGALIGPELPRLAWGATTPGRSERLDTGWRFVLADPAGAAGALFGDAEWQAVTLPHTAHLEALVTGAPRSETYQWQGVCWYRRILRLEREDGGRKVFLRFEAAMNVAEVFLDGQRIGRHAGGFLPFTLDLTDHLEVGRDAVLAVRLDNRDDPITGPKPLRELDFNTYGGLYRYVHLVVKDRLHITDPLLADQPGSGGLFVTFPRVTAAEAVVRVQTHVRNDHRAARTYRIRTTLLSASGDVVATTESAPDQLRPGQHRSLMQDLTVHAPRLWSPAEPNLHTVRVELTSEGEVVDREETRVGIRLIAISTEGFRINGERMFLRGTNRHQEHPYVGYAVPAAAQYRDAKRIKDAGFDYIRLSHYPHAPAFMDACDELGIVVMNCIPGWQYFNPDPAFAELQYRNCRDLIRRDRNRPSVILWEVSLNETAMPPEFIARTHAIAHEEYPGDQCFTCGWTRGYDVFIQARQHGGCTGVTDVPCVVSEYGDWEYYAMTAGLNQDAWQGLSPAESNSRQLRWQGERAQLQQASNFQEAHNDNLATIAFADGLWVMFDYNRGYAPDIESSGCMDIFRVPKYAYHFFRSQRSAIGPHPVPVVFIASEWTPESANRVRVFSNCDQVELRLNGRRVARQGPDRGRTSTRLAHPPFTFALERFEPGALEAVGYLGELDAVRHTVRTPGPVERIELSLDLRGVPRDPHAKDVLFCHATLTDADGARVAAAWENVAFGATGSVTIVGANPFSTDAGVSSVLLETQPADGVAAVYALALVRTGERVRVLHTALALGGALPAYEVRCSVGEALGSQPYAGPFTAAAPVRAAILIGGSVVAVLDERTPKFRVPASAPPEAPREPFRHG